MPHVPPPSQSTLRWVLTSTQADEVLSVRPLTGGWTSAIHAVFLRRGDTRPRVVLRRLFREPWRTHAKELLLREAGVLELLADYPIPAAGLLAVDPCAERTDAPALLMSQLPGQLLLDDPSITGQLADMLVRIHEVRVEDHDRPREYQSWAVPERCVVPEWAEAPDLWRHAFAIVADGPPAYRGCFLHRDFHPGNVLFDGGTISGVVDWVETSWGPADLDVAHCSTALALLHGTEAAEDFRSRYLAAGGTLDGIPYWSIIDAVGFLPDPEKVAAPWRQTSRPDLTPALARRRLERHLALILATHR